MNMKDYLAEVVTSPTLTMLKNYQTKGWLTRTFMLIEHERMLNDIVQSKGRYASYTAPDKELLEVRIYLELFERLCQSIEDFTSIIYGLLGEMKDFSKHLLNAQSPEKILKRMDKTSIEKLLQYAQLDTLPLNKEEQEFLGMIREKNVGVWLNILDILRKFLGHFWVLYNKFKHTQITIMQGFSPFNLDGEKFYLVPAIYNQENPSIVKGLIVSRSVYEKWKTMLNAVITMTKEIVNRAVFVIETNNTSISEISIFHEITESDKLKLQQIIQKCHADVERIIINVQVNANISLEDMIKQLEFYNFDLSALPS